MTDPKSKRRDPAFPFYADDFLGGTAEMSAEEVGGYIRLLCHQWTKGSIPNDEERLGRMAGLMGSPSLRYVVAKFALCDDGNLRNRRLDQIRIEREAYKARQADSGASGAKKRWNGKRTDGDPNGDPMATQLATPIANGCPKHSFPSPPPINTPLPPEGVGDSPKEDTKPKRPRKVIETTPAFEKFWNAYPNRVAKANALKAWSKLNPDETLSNRITDDVRRRATSEAWTKDGGQFTPHPATYLNQRRWEDETAIPAKTSKRWSDAELLAWATR